MYRGFTTEIIEKCCENCEKSRKMEVFKCDIIAWSHGYSAKKCFSYLSLADQLFLETGLCEDCRKKLLTN